MIDVNIRVDVNAPVHVKDAPMLDKDSDNDVVSFIDKNITCALPDPETRPELHKLV